MTTASYNLSQLGSQYNQGGTGAVARTTASKLQESVSVLDFGADPTGSTDSTTAINAAISYAKSLTYGATIYFPVGTYAVTEINLTNTTAVFSKTIKLYGAGRFMSRIVPYAAGNVLLNMMGTNDAIIQDLHFDSSTYASQCAIFLARSTTSTNCNNNKFFNVWFTGNYSVAPVVSNGSESSYWIGGRFENSNAAANYCCFNAGGATGVKALQNITTVNGGTILDSGNPATDNKMFGIEFYCPYANANVIKFLYSAEYCFTGCTLVAGSSNNVHLVTYLASTAASNTFIGPVTWFGCHFEVYGTGNVVHYVNGNGISPSFFNGINSYGGYCNTFTPGLPPAAVIDFDRTTVNEQPILRGSTFTTPSVSPGCTGTTAYIYGLFGCNFALKSNESDGTLILSGYAQTSTIDVTYYIGGATRFVSCYHTTVASALPTTGTYTVGETIQRETPVVGQPTGWKCTVSGTLGTLSGITGSITTGTNALTLNSVTGVSEGQRINVAGSSGGPYYIRKLSGTTAYLDSNAGATVTGAAVSFSNATLTALANL